MPYKDPTKRKNYQKKYHRDLRAGLQKPRQTLLALLPQKLQTCQDILKELGEQVALVKNDKESTVLERARCVAYLLSVALRAVEAGDLEGRLATLEEMVSSRGGAA